MDKTVKDILDAKEVLDLYQKLVAGNSIEDISREMNIPLDILKNWESEHYTSVKDEILKLKKEASLKRHNDDNELEDLKRDLGSINVEKLF